MKKQSIFILYILLLFSALIVLFCTSLFDNSWKFDLRFSIFFILAILFEAVGFSVLRMSNNNVRLTGGLLINVLMACVLPISEAIFISSFSVVFSGLVLAHSKDMKKYLFNISQIGISIYVVSIVFDSLKTLSITVDMWFALLASLLYIFTNSLLFSIGLYLVTNNSFQKSFVNTIKVPFLSAFMSLPLIALAYVLYNFIDLLSIPLIFGAFLAIQLGNLFRSEYQQSKFENLKLMVKSLELKDLYTSGHSEKASRLAYLIAKKLGLSEKECERIRTACILHDVGKIGVPDYILNKPEKLSDKEFEVIKTHPTKSEELLRTVNSLKGKEAKWVRHHHERWDGMGYPDGLKGEEIPLPSRIIAAADVYEALTSARPYRDSYSKEKAIEMIKEMSGTVLDPNIASILIEIVTDDQFGA